MKKDIKSKKIIFVLLILFSVLFVIGTIYGIIDFNKSKTTYDELEYREYTFLDYEIENDPDGVDKFYISVEEHEKTLYVSELLTGHKYDDFDALEAGDILYCYVYEKGGTICVAEIKAEEMIISLEDYNNAYRKNGLGLIIVMSVLSVACAIFAAIYKSNKEDSID